MVVFWCGPRIVKEIKNTDTGAVTTIEPVKQKQVISKETANSLLDMLESVVTNGTGRYATVKGYSVAGKTGTSEPDDSDKDKKYVASFAAISPVESPEVVVLLTLYGPKGKSYHGSRVAAPVVSQILTEVLPYLGIPSEVSGNTNKNDTKDLPNVKNKTVAEAKKIIEKAGFNCKISGEEEDLVTEQTPKAGTKLVSGATVLLYTKGNDTKVSQTVPKLNGKTISEYKAALKEKNLNIRINGSGIIVSQDIAAGTSVEEGTVVGVTLQKEIDE